MSYQVVWDGTKAVSGRYLLCDDEPTRPAPVLYRHEADTNRMGLVRAWFANGRTATMLETLAAVAPTEQRHSYRRAVYLLVKRGHLRVVGTRMGKRRHLVERVYGAAV